MQLFSSEFLLQLVNACFHKLKIIVKVSDVSTIGTDLKL